MKDCKQQKNVSVPHSPLFASSIYTMLPTNEIICPGVYLDLNRTGSNPAIYPETVSLTTTGK